MDPSTGLTDHVYGEEYRRMPRSARSSPMPLDVLRARFEADYLPALRQITVDTITIANPQVLAITDSDDVPTRLLAELSQDPDRVRVAHAAGNG